VHGQPQFADLPAEALVEGMVTEHPPGAPIGWARATPQFEIVIGISLAAESRMRFKPPGARQNHIANPWNGGRFTGGEMAGAK
jgi:hypothetical protein